METLYSLRNDGLCAAGVGLAAGVMHYALCLVLTWLILFN